MEEVQRINRKAGEAGSVGNQEGLGSPGLIQGWSEIKDTHWLLLVAIHTSAIRL